MRQSKKIVESREGVGEATAAFAKAPYEQFDDCLEMVMDSAPCRVPQTAPWRARHDGASSFQVSRQSYTLRSIRYWASPGRWQLGMALTWRLSMWVLGSW